MTTSLRLVGNGDARTPDHASLDITADIDIRVAVAMNDWTPSAEVAFVTKWGPEGQLSYLFNLLSNGRLRFGASEDGDSVGFLWVEDSSAAPVVADGAILAVRVTVDANNGSGGYTINFYTKATTPSTAAADVASDAGWTQLGTTRTNSPPHTIFSGNLPLVVGGSATKGYRATGRFYAVVVKSGINGTTVADPDFTSDPDDSFVDGTGKTWTLEEGAIIERPPDPLTAGTDSVDKAVYETDPIAPGADKLVVVEVVNTKASNADEPSSLVGCGLNWTKIRSVPFGPSNGYRLTLYRAMGGAPAPGTLVVTFPSGQTGCGWIVNEVGGLNTGGAGSNAVRNSAQAVSSGTGTSLTVTLPSIANQRNVAYGAFAWIAAGAVTPGSGFSEIAEVQEPTAPARTLQTEFKVGRDNTVDATGPSVAAGGIAGIALELRVAGNLQTATLTSSSLSTVLGAYESASMQPSADSLVLAAVQNAAGIPHLLLDGTGDYATTPDHASLDVPSDLDIRVAVAMNDWSPAALQTLMSKYDGTGGWRFHVNSTGSISLDFRDQGNTYRSHVTPAPTPGDGNPLLVRATANFTAKEVKYWTKPYVEGQAAADLAANTGWTLLATVAMNAASTSIGASAATVRFGALNDGTSNLAGKVYAGQVRSGIDGTVVANPDFTSGPTFPYVDSAGRTWSLAGNAVIGVDRLPAPAPSSLVGCGMTWVEVATIAYGTNDSMRLTILRAMSDAPTAGTVVITFPSVQMACEWAFAEFNHVSKAGTNGSGALRQPVTGGGGTTPRTTLSVPLSAFLDAAINAAFGAFSVDADNAVTPGAGFAQLQSVRNAEDTETLFTEWKTGEDLGVDASWASNVPAAGFAAEVVYASPDAGVPGLRKALVDVG